MNKSVGKIADGSIPSAKLPTHEVIYRQLRDLVLFGDLAPGQAVTIQGLTQRLGAGMTPVREAIRRLIAEGALEFQGNRRVCVPLLGSENIEELIVARQWLDTHLTSRAAERATQDDINELTSIDENLDVAISKGDLRSYLEWNYKFHMKLYRISDSSILASVAEGLWLRFGPSMRVVCGRMGTQNLPDKHKSAIEAIKRRDAESAAKSIHEDVTQGMEQLRLAMKDSPDRS